MRFSAVQIVKQPHKVHQWFIPRHDSYKLRERIIWLIIPRPTDLSQLWWSVCMRWQLDRFLLEAILYVLGITIASHSAFPQKRSTCWIDQEKGNEKQLGDLYCNSFIGLKFPHEYSASVSTCPTFLLGIELSHQSKQNALKIRCTRSITSDKIAEWL